MRKLVSIVCVLAVVGLAGDAAAAAKKVDLQEQELYEMYFSFCNAWNKQSPNELIAFYADDADHFAADGQVATGREEIRTLFARQLGGVYKGTKLKLTLDNMRFLSPEIVIANGSFELTGVPGPDGPLPAVKGLHTDVWTIHDGQWRVAASRIAMPARVAPPVARQAAAAPADDEVTP